MRYILAPRNHSILKEFASAKVLLAFDFDGVLAPIVSDPDRSAIPPSTRKLLQKLASRYPCIIVSGRGRADVRRRLKGIGFQEIIGNHGIEPWASSHAMAQRVARWVPVLKQRLERFRGIVLEDKQFSVSVHYRKERNKKEALKAIIAIAQKLPGASLVGGKQVVNVVPRGAPDKGLAVERERRKRRCDKVVYIGDDETDENVFALGRSRRFLTIRVGAKKSSLARFYIRNQQEIDQLLQSFIELRERASRVPSLARCADPVMLQLCQIRALQSRVRPLLPTVARLRGSSRAE
jgi:trehalose 6-phosphate phosphatase